MEKWTRFVLEKGGGLEVRFTVSRVLATSLFLKESLRVEYAKRKGDQ